MAPSPLTVVAKVRSGQEVSLKDLLEDRGTDIFVKSGKTHFANWVVFPHPDGIPRLLLSSNYDGGLVDYVEELVSTAPQICEIWEKCEGYRGKERLLGFMKAHSYPSQAYFSAFQHREVNALRAYATLHDQIENFFDLDQVSQSLGAPTFDEFLQTLSAVVEPPPPLVRAGRDIRHSLGAAWQSAHDQFFALLLGLAKKVTVAGLTDDFRSVAANVGQNVQQFSESIVVQNQMTNLAEVKPGQLGRARLALAFTNFLATYGFPPGELAGVRTIHFARWVLIDGGKYMLFQGNFDGSWENYMGDFVDKIAWGLDAVWGATVGYPTAGMRDIDAFKRYIRERQFIPQAMYSAYPLDTVLNMVRSFEVCGPLSARFDIEATRRWLQLL